MTTYTAWDGNEYPLPTPEGWYLGTDDRWWPEGHGPGPAAAAPSASGLPSAAPPPTSPDWATAPETTIYSSPEPRSGGEPAPEPAPSTGGGGNGRMFLVLGLVLLGLVAVGAGAFVALGSGDDDDDADESSSLFPSEESDTTEVAPATTAAPGDETATTAAVIPGKGSIDDPYGIGETIVVQYTDGASGELRTWNIEVLSAASDITEAVLDENQFNDRPEGDLRFIGVPIRVTYVSGPAPASLFELTFKAVGPSGVVLTTFDPSCGVIPDALDTFAEVFEGGSVEGNVCWSASPADANDLTMLLEVFLEDTEIYADLTG